MIDINAACSGHLRSGDIKPMTNSDFKGGLAKATKRLAKSMRSNIKKHNKHTGKSRVALFKACDPIK